MGAFLYFVEGRTAPVTRREQLAELGLEYAFDRLPYNARRNGPPEGGQGTMLADDARLAPYEPVYRPDEQSWQRVPERFRPGLPPLWIGRYAAAALPTPEELARPTLLPGAPVALADGRAWHVPFVRSVDGAGQAYSPLPSFIALDDQGRPKRGDLREAYRALWEAAGPFWDAWYAAWERCAANENAEFRMEIDDVTLYDSAAAMLAANYRLGPVECDLLRLFGTDGQLGDVLFCACDCAAAIRFLKKKAREPSAD